MCTCVCLCQGDSFCFCCRRRPTTHGNSVAILRQFLLKFRIFNLFSTRRDARGDSTLLDSTHLLFSRRPARFLICCSCVKLVSKNGNGYRTWFEFGVTAFSLSRVRPQSRPPTPDPRPSLAYRPCSALCLLFNGKVKASSLNANRWGLNPSK